MEGDMLNELNAELRSSNALADVVEADEVTTGADGVEGAGAAGFGAYNFSMLFFRSVREGAITLAAVVDPISGIGGDAGCVCTGELNSNPNRD